MIGYIAEQLDFETKHTFYIVICYFR